METIALINRYKDKILNVVIIIITLITARNIYKDQAQKIELIKAEKTTQIKKNAVLGQISQSEKVIGSYKNLFSEKDMSLVINTIGNIAKESNVKILSLKPGKKEEHGNIYTTYPFDLTVGADNYSTIRIFIGKLENYSDFYFVDTIDIKKPDKTDKSRESDRAYGLVVHLTLGVALFL